ncbi:hypothetical protein M422DRAFT_271908 [Sphaerobolus stellatus SS14]|uniref:Unplaced genomic scaffold SPHSTscaffold_276, whole genome shotgun sequence n=1 Tax=Sphaerobolus stellatus (strain SS14) TaxID=990650 RepID=A0A0C9UNB1_SPHS4|nr:hypothetical protein M422DRAFT_271908 [Sphaerobolus stellatus SS14]
MPSVFPPELWETIIDHLHDDIPSLCSCGLVCWEWNIISRFHLFSPDLKLYYFNLDSVLQLISAEDSTIPRHIRSLHIATRTNEEWDTVWENLSLLPSLQSLWLYYKGKDLKSLTSRAKSSFEQVLRSVTSLNLLSITFESFSQACDLINNASQVKELMLWSTSCDSYEKSDVQIVLPKLSYLKADADISTHLFDKFCSQNHAPPIRTLQVSLHRATIDGVRLTCKFITSLGPTLEELRLFVDKGEYITLSNEIDLSQLPLLRSISFDLFWFIPFEQRRGFTDWIFKIFNPDISTPSLQTVKFILGLISEADELDIFDLPAMGALFSDKQYFLYRNSAKLVFCFHGEEADVSTAIAAVKESLHTLDAEGRLEFVDC